MKDLLTIVHNRKVRELHNLPTTSPKRRQLSYEIKQLKTSQLIVEESLKDRVILSNVRFWDVFNRVIELVNYGMGIGLFIAAAYFVFSYVIKGGF